jgi:undecaprenyl diphosphate synthase
MSAASPATTSITHPRRALSEVEGVPRERLPRHIAVIMDGNGRWALNRGLPRIEGHRAGARAVRAVVTECARLGLGVLTLYSFSLENWKRPADEVGALMELCLEYLINERSELLENNIRFVRLGRRDGLPREVLEQLDQCEAATARCTGLTLALALNYGSRAEIADAVRAIARDVRSGRLAPEDITEASISARLYTAGLPDPDLLIRTAGEFRLSNYLLWQLSYAELHVTETLWPDFDVPDLHAAIRDFAGRQRRYGGLASQ